uniref:Expressed protein n=1 Tax=Echinococcus granulosus TaxID=6210 RepID=A0A068WJW4_ECHGR|nr:expressed protein [Echinococcus granulosus]
MAQPRWTLTIYCSNAFKKVTRLSVSYLDQAVCIRQPPAPPPLAGGTQDGCVGSSQGNVLH